MSQRDENMEYLEAYDDAHLDTIEEDAEEINRRLDILDQDRMARENGEKPAEEWTRRDFNDLLRSNSKLRHLSTCELRALFLRYGELIDDVLYYKRMSMEDSLYRRDNHDTFFSELAISHNAPFERWASHGYHHAGLSGKPPERGSRSFRLE